MEEAGKGKTARRRRLGTFRRNQESVAKRVLSRI
jgi:hypothetical protein